MNFHLKNTEEAENLLCCLCEKGKILQHELVQHLRARHGQNELLSIDYCVCPEGVKLQHRLINHLLSHIPKIDSCIKQVEPPKGSSSTLIETKQSSDVETNFGSERSFCSNHQQGNSSEDEWDEDDFPEDTYVRSKAEIGNHKATSQIIQQTSSAIAEQEKQQQLECDLCNKKFKTSQKFSLQLHIEEAHLKNRTAMRPYFQRKSRIDTSEKVICFYCSAFITRSSLEAHILQMHEKHKMKHICDFEGCNERFLHKSLLLKHKDHHLGIKRLSCEYCGKK
jgi:hypothetical protein